MEHYLRFTLAVRCAPYAIEDCVENLPDLVSIKFCKNKKGSLLNLGHNVIDEFKNSCYGLLVRCKVYLLLKTSLRSAISKTYISAVFYSRNFSRFNFRHLKETQG